HTRSKRDWSSDVCSSDLDATPAPRPAGTMGGLPGRRSPGDDPRRTLMIVTLTPNPAVDVTYTVPRLSPGEVHRVQQVVESAGGRSEERRVGKAESARATH